MSYKTAAFLGLVGLVMVVASIFYGRSSPIENDPDKTEERIATATSRHAHIMSATKAQERNRNVEEELAKLRALNEKAAHLRKEREAALAKHRWITNALRYGGSILMLGGAAIVLSKSQT